MFSATCAIVHAVYHRMHSLAFEKRRAGKMKICGTNWRRAAGRVTRILRPPSLATHVSYDCILRELRQGEQGKSCCQRSTSRHCWRVKEEFRRSSSRCAAARLLSLCSGRSSALTSYCAADSGAHSTAAAQHTVSRRDTCSPPCCRYLLRGCARKRCPQCFCFQHKEQ